MRLRDTEAGRAWINRFDLTDRGTATLLLDSLRVVSQDRFYGELRHTFTRYVRDLDGPIAMYAVREIEGNESYFENNRNRPDPARSRVEMGSEGPLAYFATCMNRSNTRRFLNHPPIATLRRRRCRHVLLLDDFSGSGNRVIEFLNGLRRSATIVSWCSYHLIQFHLVAYAISEQAEAAILDAFQSRRAEWPRANVSFRFAKRPGVAPGRWRPDDEARILNLCIRYGQRGGIPWVDRQGHRQSMAMMVFAHGCPNNAPGILWRVTDRWPWPLFPNRVIPDELLRSAFGSGNPPENPTDGIRTPRSALDTSFEVNDPVRIDMMRLLRLIRCRVRGEARLADILDISVASCEELLERCLRFGLTDIDNRLTELGRNELRQADAGNRISDIPPLTTEFYFPRQLRGPRVASS